MGAEHTQVEVADREGPALRVRYTRDRVQERNEVRDLLGRSSSSFVLSVSGQVNDTFRRHHTIDSCRRRDRQEGHQSQQAPERIGAVVDVRERNLFAGEAISRYALNFAALWEVVGAVGIRRRVERAAWGLEEWIDPVNRQVVAQIVGARYVAAGCSAAATLCACVEVGIAPKRV